MPPDADGNETDEERQAREAAEAAARGNDDSDDDDDDDFDKDRALNTIRTIRASEAAYKKQAAEAQKRLKELEDRDKSEVERLTAERNELLEKVNQHEKAAKDRVTREAFQSEAQRAGALKPDALFRLAEGLEIDDDGQPTNTKTVIKSLRDAYPELFNNSDADGSAGRGRAVKPSSMNELIRRSRGR